MATIDVIHDRTDYITSHFNIPRDQFLALFKRHNGLTKLPTPSNPSPNKDFVLLINKLNKAGDSHNAMIGEDMDMESLTSSPPNTGGRVVMANKKMELLKGLL